MRNDINLKLKEIQLEMFQCFLNIVGKYKLQYFLVGGSCLGGSDIRVLYHGMMILI